MARHTMNYYVRMEALLYKILLLKSKLTSEVLEVDELTKLYNLFYV